MKHIKLFEDIISWDEDKVKMGNKINPSDEHLILTKDLVLELQDNGCRVNINAYYAYHEGYICYDIFVNKPAKNEIFDITSDSDLNIDLTDITFIRDTMKDILSRLIDNGLYLGSHSINMKDHELYSHSRLFKRIDGGDMKGFTYGDDPGDDESNY